MRGQPGKKLPEEQIEQICRLIGEGHSVEIVAQRTGVSKSLIWQIARKQHPTAQELAEYIWPSEGDPEPS